MRILRKLIYNVIKKNKKLLWYLAIRFFIYLNYEDALIEFSNVLKIHNYVFRDDGLIN